MIGKFLFFLSAATAMFIGLSAGAVTTSQNVDIIVTHSAPPTPIAGSCPCAAGNAPNVCVNTPTVAANQPLSISWACGPSNANSYIALINPAQTDTAGQALMQPYYSILGGAASGTTTLTAPNYKVDRDLPWYVGLYQNYQANGGQVAQSSAFTVQKSLNPPAPTATLPVALAAAPFTPAHTLTVCASSCGFTDLGSAVHNAAVNGWDNVKIVISAGDYPFPAFTLPTPADYPAHLWIYGISSDGQTFPHLFGFTMTAGNIFFTDKCGTGACSLTLDNLEIGPWNAKAMVPTDGTTWTLRNDYVHDTLDGLESSNNTSLTINIYNSVFARSGGGAGPDHNVYIGLGNLGSTVNVINSVFEQANTGHSFKTRASVNTFTCSMFALNEDNVNLGSQDMDIDGSTPTINKSLLVQADGAGEAWNNQNAWDNQKFAVDNEAGYTVYNEVLTNSNIVNDHNSTVWPMILGQRFTGPNPVPAIWSGNKFVWSNPSSRDTSGDGGETTLNGAVSTQHSGNIADVTLDGTNNYYTSWAAAGFSVVPNQEPYGWRDFLSMMPSGCTDPVGLVKIPAG
jgi:hypothetical protein